jgi:hypothetical protein
MHLVGLIYLKIISVSWNNRARSLGRLLQWYMRHAPRFVIVTADLTQGSVILREKDYVLWRIDGFRSFRIKKAKLFCPLTFLWSMDAARSSESWCP